MVKINIEIKKRDLRLLVPLLGVMLLVGVIAYNSAISGGNPAVMGHSADEVMVKVGSRTMTLQAALENGMLGGKGSLECVTITKSCTSSNVDTDSDCIGTAVNQFQGLGAKARCPAGYNVTGGGLKNDDQTTAVDFTGPLRVAPAGYNENTEGWMGWSYQSSTIEVYAVCCRVA